MLTRGRVRVTAVNADTVVPATSALGAASSAGVWRRGDGLYRSSAFGPELIGTIVGGESRAWVGAKLGGGFDRVGAMTLGFVFRPDRRGLIDGIRLPALRGVLIDSHATISDELIWMFWRAAHGGRITTTVVVLDAAGTIRATHTTGIAAADDTWTDGLAGACAIGAFLFVPTDDGLCRVDVVGTDLAVARRYPDTADVVCGGDVLAAADTGVFVRRAHGAVRLELT